MTKSRAADGVAECSLDEPGEIVCLTECEALALQLFNAIQAVLDQDECRAYL